MEGMHLALSSQLGTEQNGAFVEGVHLWRVHLWRVDCIIISIFITLFIKCDIY
jgi:hypothetical protein